MRLQRATANHSRESFPWLYIICWKDSALMFCKIKWNKGVSEDQREWEEMCDVLVCVWNRHLVCPGSSMEGCKKRSDWKRSSDKISRKLWISGELHESYLALSVYLCGKLTPLGWVGWFCGMHICPSKPWNMLSGTTWSAAELSSEEYEEKTLNPGFWWLQERWLWWGPSEHP